MRKPKKYFNASGDTYSSVRIYSRDYKRVCAECRKRGISLVKLMQIMVKSLDNV